MLRSGDILEERYAVHGPEPLGQGGMGKVWKAVDRKTGVIVAVKEFEPDPKEKLTTEQRRNLQDLFVKEAELLAGLEYDAFPKVRDRCVYNQTPCIVMDYIPGEDLGKILEKNSNKPFEIELIYDWTAQILEALSYLHNLPNPIIHKDLKPSNLKVTSNNRIRILDFGIAKGHIGEMTASQLSIPLGTIPYAPLEQALKVSSAYSEILWKKHQDKVDFFINKKTVPQSDVFALCATVYRLLVGALPQNFNALARASFVWNNESDPLPELRRLNSKIPAEFSELIKKGMSLEIEDRFESAVEMQAALKIFRENEYRQLKNQERQDFEDKLRSRLEYEFHELRIDTERKSRQDGIVIEQKNEEIKALKKSAERLNSTSIAVEEFKRVQESARFFEKQVQTANNNLPEIKKQVIRQTASTFSRNLLDKLSGKSLSGSDEFDSQNYFQKEFDSTVGKLEEILRSDSATPIKKAVVETVGDQKRIALISSVYTLALPLPLFLVGYFIFIWSLEPSNGGFKQKLFLLVPAVLLSLAVPIFSSLIFYVGEKFLGTGIRSKILTRYRRKFIWLLFLCGISGAVAGFAVDYFFDKNFVIMRGNFLGMMFGWLIFILLFYRDLMKNKT